MAVRNGRSRGRFSQSSPKPVEAPAMRLPRVRLTIGQVMMVVALVAFNLAVASATPQQVATLPFLWGYLVGPVDFVVLWKLILKRPLQASHYTCLIVFLVSFAVLANLVATGRLRLMSALVLW